MNTDDKQDPVSEHQLGVKKPVSGACPFLGGMQNIESAAEMEELLRSPSFEKRGGGADSRPNQAAFILGGTLINLWGEKHRTRRRAYSPLFSSRKALMELQDWLVPQIRSRIDELPHNSDGQSHTDVVKFVRNISLEIAARIIGLEDMQPIVRVELLGTLADRMMGAIKSHLDFRGDAVPPADLQRAKDEFIAGRVADAKAAKEEFVRIFYEPARRLRAQRVDEHRAGRCSEADLPKDVLTLLIMNEAQMRAEPTWDDDLPVRECLMILAAADHTTSMATCHSISDLFSWVEAHPEDKPKLMDADFLRRAALESLRLHQVTDPNPNLRAATKDVVFSTGRKISKDEIVATRFGVGSRDTANFGEDANEFNPYRQIGGSVQRAWGFAFSGGVHSCLAMSLVIGTGDGEEFKGDLPLMLSTLFEAGMRPDPANPPVPKIHAYVDPESGGRREIDVWSSYRVVFNTK